MVNGIDELVITKLDVLGDFDELKVCVGYEVDGRALRHFPSEPAQLARVQPVYETLPGWSCQLDGAGHIEDLPGKAREYVAFVEEFVGAKVGYVGIGPEREQVVASGVPT
jgi:adenylosuccinate synthase